MTQTLVQVRIDRKLKEQTASIYEAIGVDLPTAIRMFFKKSVMVGGLPMRAKVESANAEEPLMDEINDFISSVRKNRQPVGQNA